MKKFTKDSKWLSYDFNTFRKISNLDTTHLINIIHHVKTIFYEDGNDIIDVCKDILTDRNINLKILNFGQLPHKNNYGTWSKWDYDINGPVELSHIKHDIGASALKWSNWLDKEVIKKSNKPFKSGEKIGKVIDLTINIHSNKLAFKMCDESIVDCHICKII